jgi:hypothetical protein
MIGATSVVEELSPFAYSHYIYLSAYVKGYLEKKPKKLKIA